MKVWLGLGSNLQQPAEQVKDALSRLAAIDGISILRISSFYITPPWGDQQQDDFINAVAEIETSLEPVSLLRKFQSIEQMMGRKRSSRQWGPRLIDIDLLLYGDRQIELDELEVPHPRMHERAFVLVPLAELDPDLAIPGRGPVENCLQQIDCGGIRRRAEENLD
jgi:2-amino-4-hydroxy-6-hydroxymethyldihydropteridine diphosphokinase